MKKCLNLMKNRLNFLNLKFLKILIFAIVLIFLFIFSSFISSCKIFDNNNSKETATTVTEPSTKEETQQTDTLNNQVVELNIWTKIEPKEQIELTNSIEIFSSNNPYVKITTKNFRNSEELLDQFTASSLAGAGPDLLITEIESLKALAPAGVIRPITEDIFGDILNKDFFKGLEEISIYENKTFSLPFRAFNFLMLFYNKDYIEKPPVEFIEIINYCKNVNNPGKDKWGFLFNWKEPDWIIPFCGGYQGWIYDYETNSIFLDTQEMIQTLQFLYDIYNKEKILPFNVDYGYINEAFKVGNVHMIINGDWAVNEYNSEGINFGVSKIPVVFGGFKNPTPMINGIGFLFNVNSYGKNLEESKNFVNFLLDQQSQERWTKNTDTLPVLNSMMNDENIKNDELLLNQLKQGAVCRGKIPEEILRVIRDSIRQNIESVLNGSIKPEDAAKKMQEDAIKLKKAQTFKAE